MQHPNLEYLEQQIFRLTALFGAATKFKVGATNTCDLPVASLKTKLSHGSSLRYNAMCLKKY